MRKNKAVFISGWNVYNIVSFFLILYITILLFILKNPEAIYSDAGFNYTQLINFIEKNYKDFSYNYKASYLDPEKRLLPYTKPWIGIHDGQYYLQYPPWFFLTVLPLYLITGIYGFLIFNLIFLVILFIVLRKMIQLGDYPESERMNAAAAILLMFAASMTFYALHFHEYILAWSSAAFSLYLFLLINLKKTSWTALFAAGLFLGFSVVLRLEILIAFAPIVIHTVLREKKIHIRDGIFILSGLLIPLLISFIGNYLLHGHPLSFRYINNVTESNAGTLYMKLYYIRRILLDKEIGLIVQSPWVLAIPFIWMVYRREKLIRLSALWFILSTAAVLIMLPNDGSHFAPRYLFATLPLAAILAARPFSDFSMGSYLHTMKSAKAVFGTVAFILLILMSLIKYKDQLVRQLLYQQNIITVNRILKKIPENNLIVFREYATPQNAQFVLVHRKFVVADTSDKVSYLIQNIKKNNKENITLAFPVMNIPDKPYSREELLKLAEEIPSLNYKDFEKAPETINLHWPFLLLDYFYN